MRSGTQRLRNSLPMNFLADKVNSFKALAGGGRRASFKLSTLVEKHALLVRVAVVSERNREAVVEALRAVTELLIWGDKHDAAFFEFFLEKNMVAIFWRLLAQPATAMCAQMMPDVTAER